MIISSYMFLYFQGKKKKYKEKWYFHVWFLYEKYKRKLNMIKISWKLMHFQIIQSLHKRVNMSEMSLK